MGPSSQPFLGRAPWSGGVGFNPGSLKLAWRDDPSEELRMNGYSSTEDREDVIEAVVRFRSIGILNLSLPTACKIKDMCRENEERTYGNLPKL
jgi:hypothetical protein